MSVHLIALIIAGLYLLASVVMLFLGGQLVRNDLNRAAAEREGVRRPVRVFLKTCVRFRMQLSNSSHGPSTVPRFSGGWRRANNH